LIPPAEYAADGSGGYSAKEDATGNVGKEIPAFTGVRELERLDQRSVLLVGNGNARAGLDRGPRVLEVFRAVNTRKDITERDSMNEFTNRRDFFEPQR